MLTDDQFQTICRLVNPFASPTAFHAKSDESEDLGWFIRFCELHSLRAAILRRDRFSDREWPYWKPSQNWARAHAFRSMQRVGEIIVISRALEEAGISAIFFKGAVLAQELFGGPQHREYNDIDVLVSPDCQELASEILERLGYMPIVRDKQMRQSFFDYVGQHMHFNLNTGTTIDLHWRFVGAGPFPVQVEEVLRNRRFMVLGSASVPIACTDDLALILAGHGQKEGWASFSWALDLATFAAQNPTFDWNFAFVRAKANKSSRSILAAALLINQIFGHKLSGQLLIQAKNHLSIVNEVDCIIAQYKALTDRDPRNDFSESCRLCDSFPERFKVVLDSIFTPSIGDFEAIHLPRYLWWAYRPVRPVRLLWRKIRGRTREESAFWAKRMGLAKTE
ncbi:nucleotidyltransferase family protein [Novosphingobium aquae]|uniref:Nucleotidyltransferase family protein n=1 Tax=Novosphingobium aquae TaxID=3133435 RepID=A0ABU8SDX1_9SPHN